MSSLSFQGSNHSTASPRAEISSMSTHPVAINRKRRKSSFNTADSPYAIRKSFLSKSMLEDDDFQSYELSSYGLFGDRNFDSEFSRIPSYSINLTKSQGFIWNQDLFATSYQQRKAGLVPSSVESTPDPVKVIDIIVSSDEEEDSHEERRPKEIKGGSFNRYKLRPADDGSHFRLHKESRVLSEKSMEAEDTYFPGDSQACGGEW